MSVNRQGKGQYQIPLKRREALKFAMVFLRWKWMICVSVNSGIIYEFQVGKITTIFSADMTKIQMSPQTTKFLISDALQKTLLCFNFPFLWVCCFAKTQKIGAEQYTVQHTFRARLNCYSCFLWPAWRRPWKDTEEMSRPNLAIKL